MADDKSKPAEKSPEQAEGLVTRTLAPRYSARDAATKRLLDPGQTGSFEPSFVEKHPECFVPETGK